MAVADFAAQTRARTRAVPEVLPGRESAGSLVGRARELDQLNESFDVVAGGRALGMLIGGDAGVGKSRIVEEFSDRSRLRGAVVATGLCLPADNAMPYAPVVGILRDLGRRLGSPPRAAALLAAMGGYLDVTAAVTAGITAEVAVDATVAPDVAATPAATPAVADPDAGNPAGRLPAGPFAKTLLFETVLQEIAAIAEQAPVVLVFEDLHWSDSASSELFDFLIRNLADARVLTLGTYREDELDRDHPLTPWLAELCMWDARAAADQYLAARAAGRVPDEAQSRRRIEERFEAVHRAVTAREERSAAPTPRLLAGLAQTAAERSRLDRSDPELWEKAARLWEEAREAYPEAYCRWREAEAVLEARGARTRAAASLDAAYRIGRRLGAEPLLSRIAQLAQRGRLELSGTDATDATDATPAARAAEALGLTPREVEVLGLLAAGCSDREIAETLFISKKTVSVHVSNVLRKLAVGRRYEAARIGQAHGLGTPAPGAGTQGGAFQ